MRKLAMIIAMVAGASVSAIAQQSAPMPELGKMPPVTMPDAVTTDLNWFLIALEHGPVVPPGWQVVNVEARTINGNTVNGWRVFIFNPSTRQLVGWQIGLR